MIMTLQSSPPTSSEQSLLKVKLPRENSDIIYARKQAAALALARLEFVSFMLATFRGYTVGRHHRIIADALIDVLEGRCKRLMIFLPPRHGKSEEVSIRFPPFALGKYPEKNIIATSYGDDLAQTFGGKARDIVASPLYQAIFPEVRISASTSSKTKWALEHRVIDHINGEDVERWISAGGYVGAGIGGPITGRGADIGIIDDPVKNREEAESEVYQEKIWEWYKSTFFTRLEKGGAVILMMTRWVKNDLAGKLLEAWKNGEGDAWRVIKLPAIAGADDPWRKEGEALWREKYDEKALEEIKIVVGTRHWNALYQQEPTEEEGGVFKRTWWKRIPWFDAVKWTKIHSWDTAWEQTDGAAYTCCQTWIRSDLGYYLLRSRRWKLQYPEIKKKMKELFKEEKPDGILVEYKASGIACVQELQADGELPVIPWPRPGEPLGSKLVRALANSPMVEAGQVFIVGDGQYKDEKDGTIKNWIDEYIDEHADFPNGKYKDQVDCTSQALSYLKDSAGVATVMQLSGMGFSLGRPAAIQGDDE
jgi:predicted phage terminase large subunit-like protein